MTSVTRPRRERPGKEERRGPRYREEEEETRKRRKSKKHEIESQVNEPTFFLAPGRPASPQSPKSTDGRLGTYGHPGCYLHRRWVVLICPLSPRTAMGCIGPSLSLGDFEGALFFSVFPLSSSCIASPEEPIAMACPAASRTLLEWCQRPSCGPGRRCVCQIGVMSPELNGDGVHRPIVCAGFGIGRQPALLC